MNKLELQAVLNSATALIVAGDIEGKYISGGYKYYWRLSSDTNIAKIEVVKRFSKEK